MVCRDSVSLPRLHLSRWNRVLHLNLVHQLGSVISILCQQDRWDMFIPSEAHLFVEHFTRSRRSWSFSISFLILGWFCAAECPFRPKILMKCAAAAAAALTMMLSIFTNRVDKLVWQFTAVFLLSLMGSMHFYTAQTASNVTFKTLGRIIRWWSSVITDDRHVDCFSIDIGIRWWWYTRN